MCPYLLLAVGVEGQECHGAVGSTGAWARGHPVLRGLAGTSWPAAAWTSELGTQSGAEVLLHLRPLRVLEVVLGWVLKMALDLHKQNHNQPRSIS